MTCGFINPCYLAINIYKTFFLFYLLCCPFKMCTTHRRLGELCVLAGQHITFNCHTNSSHGILCYTFSKLLRIAVCQSRHKSRHSLRTASNETTVFVCRTAAYQSQVMQLRSRLLPSIQTLIQRTQTFNSTSKKEVLANGAVINEPVLQQAALWV